MKKQIKILTAACYMIAAMLAAAIMEADALSLIDDTAALQLLAMTAAALIVSVLLIRNIKPSSPETDQETGGF